MSLNLALVISGDASGAKAAAEETSAAVRTIGVTATNAANAQATANDQAVAAASRVTQVLTGQDAALRARGAAAAASLTSVAGAARLTSSQLLNLSRQGNDVVTMFALGVPAMQIFASQAGQVYDALESGPKGLGGSLTAIRGSLASTAASFLGFVPGVGLVTTGLVAAGAAAIAYALLTRTNIQSVDDVLKTHKKIIDEIAAAYPLAAAAAKAYEDQATKVPLSVAQADAIKQAEDEKNTLAATLNNIRRRMSIATTNSPTDPAGADFAKLGQAGVVAFRQLAAEMQAGQIDAAGVQKRLGELRIDPGLSKVAHDFAEQLQDSANQAAALELHLRGSSAAIATFQGVTVGRGDEGANLTKWLAGNRAALVQLQRDRETAFRSLYARSPEEQARAARATEDARPFDPNEGKGVRDYRADTAAALAYARAQQTLDEAQKQRLRSLDQTIAAQQLDISLIGKTAAEAASLRMAFQLEQAVREEAARNNVPADEAEIRRIRQKAAEYGRLSAIQSARTTIVGQGQTIETQRAELALVGASTAAHDRVIASLQVEQQIRQLGIDLYGKEAEAMRANAAELAALAEARSRANLARDLQFERDQLGRSPIEATVADRLKGAGLAVDLNSEAAAMIRMNELLKQQKQIWEDVRETGVDAIGSIIDSAVGGFADIDSVLKSAADDVLKQLTQLGIKNPIANAVYNKGLPTLDSIGGLPGFLSTLLGGPQPAGGQSVGAMDVQAGVVNINGALGSGAGGLVDGVKRLFSPANGNSADPWSGMRGSETTMAAPASGGVGAQIWNFFAGKGLQSHQIAGIMGNLTAESGLNPNAVNPNGGASGLPQWLGSRLRGLLSANGGKVPGVGGQLDYIWKELQGPESGVLKRLLGSTDVRSATGAFAGFERAEGWSQANPENIALWQKRLTASQDALARFQGTANVATKDLGTFSGGLGQLGNALSQFPAAPAGGGLSGFSGIWSMISGFFRSPAAWSAIQSGTAGLYDVGGPTGGSDPNKVAGLVHEQEYVMDAPVVRALGVPFLDNLRRSARSGRHGRLEDAGAQMEGGYPVPRSGSRAGGGGGAVIEFRHDTVVHNYGNSSVRTEETDDGKGGRRTEVIVGEQMAAEMNRPGSAANRTLNARGARQPVKRR